MKRKNFGKKIVNLGAVLALCLPVGAQMIAPPVAQAQAPASQSSLTADLAALENTLAFIEAVCNQSNPAAMASPEMRPTLANISAALLRILGEVAPEMATLEEHFRGFRSNPTQHAPAILAQVRSLAQREVRGLPLHRALELSAELNSLYRSLAASITTVERLFARIVRDLPVPQGTVSEAGNTLALRVHMAAGRIGQLETFMERLFVTVHPAFPASMTGVSDAQRSMPQRPPASPELVRHPAIQAANAASPTGPLTDSWLRIALDINQNYMGAVGHVAPYSSLRENIEKIAVRVWDLRKASEQWNHLRKAYPLLPETQPTSTPSSTPPSAGSPIALPTTVPPQKVAFDEQERVAVEIAKALPKYFYSLPAEVLAAPAGATGAPSEMAMANQPKQEAQPVSQLPAPDTQLAFDVDLPPLEFLRQLNETLADALATKGTEQHITWTEYTLPVKSVEKLREMLPSALQRQFPADKEVKFELCRATKALGEFEGHTDLPLFSNTQRHLERFQGSCKTPAASSGLGTHDSDAL